MYKTDYRWVLCLSAMRGSAAYQGRVRLRSPSRQQRHQAALHSHLLQQRLATGHALDNADRRQRQQQQHDLGFGAAAPNQRRQQEAALEQRLTPTLDRQLASGQELGPQAGGGGGPQLHLAPRHLAGTATRLLPSHIHAPPGAQFLPEGLGFRGPEGLGLQLRPADQARMFHSARSLPAHLHQLNEVGGTVCCLAREGLSGCSGACVRLRHCTSAKGACSTSTARVRCRLAQQGLYTLVHPFYLQSNSFLPSIAAAGAR